MTGRFCAATSQSAITSPYHGDESIVTEPNLNPPNVSLESLRSVGDDVADAAVRSILPRLRTFNTCAVPSATANGSSSRRGTTGASTDHIGYQLLDAILQAESRDEITCEERAFLRSARRAPQWADWDKADRGVRLFLSMTLPAGLSLLHFSLVGGFSAPRIARVLRSTGYLSGN